MGAMGQMHYGAMPMPTGDFDGFDHYYNGQSGGAGMPPGYSDPRYGQEPPAEPPPFSGDLY